MAVIGATELQPVNILGSYVQGLEMGRANRLAQAEQQRLARQGEMEEARFAEDIAAKQATRRNAELEAALKGHHMIADFASAAVDEPSYQEVLRNLQGLGVDTSRLPPSFDPKFVAQQRRAALTEAQRIDAELRGRELGVRERTVGVQEAQAETAARQEARLSRQPAGAAIKPPKAPEGYRWTANNDLEYIPGGPKDPNVIGGTEGTKIDARERAKREASYPKVEQSLRAHKNKTTDLVTLLSELREDPALPDMLGPIESRLPTFSQATADAEAKLDTILARGQFRELQEMRNNSPTGGALGNVSNFEIQALQNAFAQLGTKQSVASFQKAIDRAIEELQRSTNNLDTAFADDFNYREDAAPRRGRRGDPSKRGQGARGTVTPAGTSYSIIEE